ncbi:MAG TPA: HEAT repeat domain-containing protein [Spirochaetia bacterium]|nr:HEAT repeat domain-containing protein [Spirochaetia bacterium]
MSRSAYARGAALVLFLTGAAFLLPAQAATAPAPKELTIEQLFLQSVEFQILREKAFSDDYDLKMSALDDLEKKIDTGATVGNDQQIEFVLEYLALEGSGHITREEGRVINNLPEVRRRSANLLGRLGTPEAQNALLRVLIIDQEPVVQSEAAYALGEIGSNPDNEVLQALVFAYQHQDPAKPDNNFAYALTLAVEKLATKTAGGLKDPDAYRLLVNIAQGAYLRTVRAKAVQVLGELQAAK